VKYIASRAALTALALLVAFAVPTRPAIADRAPAAAGPTAQATPTPIYVPLTPPPSGPPVAAAMPQPGIMASGDCANDQFLAFRTVPMPTQTTVIVCGIVTGVRGPGSTQVSVDGTKPVTVQGPNLPAVHPGDRVAVKGTYYRDKTGAEVIDAVRNASGAVTILTPGTQ
jgi:hypothetical protein